MVRLLPVYLPALWLVTACSGSTDPAAAVHLTWSGHVGVSLCDSASSESVKITSSQPGAADRVDRHPCAPQAGLIVLPPGYWSMSISLVDANDVELALGARLHVNLVAGDPLDLGNVVFETTDLSGRFPTTGTFSLSWMLSSGGAATTCAAKNVATVRLLETPLDGGTASDDFFTCNDMTGMSGPLGQRNYNVQIDLFDSKNQILSSHTINAAAGDQVIEGENTDLGSFVFDF